MPAADPTLKIVTLADLKLQMRVEENDEDNLITQYGIAAERQIITALLYFLHSTQAFLLIFCLGLCFSEDPDDLTFCEKVGKLKTTFPRLPCT